MGPIVKFSLNLTVNPSWSPAFRLEEELFGGQFSAPTANPCLSTASVQKHAWPSARALGANAGTGGDDRPGATSLAAAAFDCDRRRRFFRYSEMSLLNDDDDDDDDGDAPHSSSLTHS